MKIPRNPGTKMTAAVSTHTPLLPMLLPLAGTAALSPPALKFEFTPGGEVEVAVDDGNDVRPAREVADAGVGKEKVELRSAKKEDASRLSVA